jgi:AraC-like DNA-binding protein
VKSVAATDKVTFVQPGIVVAGKKSELRWIPPRATSLQGVGVWILTQAVSCSSTFRFVADASVHLCFDLSGLVEFEPFLLAAGAGPLNLSLPPGAMLLGVQVPIWEAFHWGDPDAPRSPRWHVAFDEHWAMRLYVALLEARNAGAELTYVFERFCGAIARARSRRYRSSFMAVARGDEPVARLPFSPRQRRRLHQTLTGLSPTQLKRVVRFQAALGQLLGTGEMPLAGYVDQSHLIREFKTFAGCTPRQLVKMAVASNHLQD